MSKRSPPSTPYKPPRKKICPSTTEKEDTPKDLAHVIILLEELKDSIEHLADMLLEGPLVESTEEDES